MAIKWRWVIIIIGINEPQEQYFIYWIFIFPFFLLLPSGCTGKCNSKRYQQ